MTSISIAFFGPRHVAPGLTERIMGTQRERRLISQPLPSGIFGQLDEHWDMTVVPFFLYSVTELFIPECAVSIRQCGLLALSTCSGNIFKTTCVKSLHWCFVKMTGTLRQIPKGNLKSTVECVHQLCQLNQICHALWILY